MKTTFNVVCVIILMSIHSLTNFFGGSLKCTNLCLGVMSNNIRECLNICDKLWMQEVFLAFIQLKECMLAYDTHLYELDESFRLSAHTTWESLRGFCIIILHLYKAHYFHRPTCSGIQQFYAHHANLHGFPGMLGILDYMHWRWSICPNAYHGQYTKGNYHYATIILEALATQDLWFWHAYLVV